MADLAALGFSVDSSPVRRASSDLDQLSTAAAKAETAADGVGRGVEQAGKRMSGMSSYSERMARDLQKIQKEMATIQAALAPLGNGFDRVVNAIEKLDRASTSGASGLRRLAKEAEAANDNVQLVSHQIANLRAQAIDVGTMLASGSSFMMVLATQSGQIYQALADGPGGSVAASMASRTL